MRFECGLPRKCLLQIAVVQFVRCYFVYFSPSFHRFERKACLGCACTENQLACRRFDKPNDTLHSKAHNCASFLAYILRKSRLSELERNGYFHMNRAEMPFAWNMSHLRCRTSRVRTPWKQADRHIMECTVAYRCIHAHTTHLEENWRRKATTATTQCHGCRWLTSTKPTLVFAGGKAE